MDDDRAPGLMRNLQVLQVESTVKVLSLQLSVQCRDPAKVIVARISGLVDGREVQFICRAYRRKTGLVEFLLQRQLRVLRGLLLLPKRSAPRTRPSRLA